MNSVSPPEARREFPELDLKLQCLRQSCMLFFFWKGCSFFSPKCALNGIYAWLTEDTKLSAFFFSGFHSSSIMRYLLGKGRYQGEHYLCNEVWPFSDRRCAVYQWGFILLRNHWLFFLLLFLSNVFRHQEVSRKKKNEHCAVQYAFASLAFFS